MNDLPVEEQIRRYREQLARDPSSSVFVALAEAHLAVSNPAEALEVCRSGLAFSPDLVAGRMVLSKALCRLGRLREAEAELAALVALAPEEEAAQELLAQLRAGQLVTLDIRREVPAKRSLNAPVAVPLEFDLDGLDDKTRGDLAPLPGAEFDPDAIDGQTVGLRAEDRPAPSFEEGATLKGASLFESGETSSKAPEPAQKLKDELSVSMEIDPDEEDEEATRPALDMMPPTEALAWKDRSKLLNEKQGGLADLFKPSPSGTPRVAPPENKLVREAPSVAAEPPVKRQTQQVPRVKSSPLIEVAKPLPKGGSPIQPLDDDPSEPPPLPAKPFSTSPLPIVKTKPPVELFDDEPLAAPRSTRTPIPGAVTIPKESPTPPPGRGAPLSKEVPSLAPPPEAAARSSSKDLPAVSRPVSREVPSLARPVSRELPALPSAEGRLPGPGPLVSPPLGTSVPGPAATLSPAPGTPSLQGAEIAAQLPIHLGRPRGSRLGLWVALVVALLVVGGGVAWWVIRGQQQDEAAAHLASAAVLVQDGSYAGLLSAESELSRARPHAPPEALLPQAAALDGLRALLFLDDRTEALGDTQARAKDASLDSEPLAFGAVVFVSRGDAARALKLAGEARARFPKSALLALAEGELRLRQGEWAAARTAYEAASTLDPELTWGRLGLAELLAATDRAALPGTLKDGLSGPRGAALGLLAKEQGESAAAAEEAERALSGASPVEEAWLRVALARRAFLSRDDSSCGAQLEALRGLSSSLRPGAALLLAELLVARGEGQAARQLLDGVAGLAEPQRLLLAEAALLAGDVAGAEKQLGTAEDPASQVLKARAALQRGEATAAQKLLAGVADKRPEAALYAIAASIAAGESKGADAKLSKLPAYPRALPQGFSVALPELLRAEVAAALGRAADASAALSRAQAQGPADEEVARRAPRLGQPGKW